MNDYTQEQLINQLISIDNTLSTFTEMPVEALKSIDLSLEHLAHTINRNVDSLYDRALNTDYILCRIAGALLAPLTNSQQLAAEAYAQELYKKAFQARAPK